MLRVLVRAFQRRRDGGFGKRSGERACLPLGRMRIVPALTVSRKQLDMMARKNFTHARFHRRGDWCAARHRRSMPSELCSREPSA